MDASDRIKQVRDKTIYINLAPSVSAPKTIINSYPSTFPDYEIKFEYMDGKSLVALPSVCTHTR